VPVANLAYNLVAAGVGVDYELLTHVDLRGDWEYQRWFGFERSSLSPSLFTVGAAYHF
jgi:opacity protein-like surface antigen